VQDLEQAPEQDLEQDLVPAPEQDQGLAQEQGQAQVQDPEEDLVLDREQGQGQAPDRLARLAPRTSQDSNVVRLARCRAPAPMNVSRSAPMV
jgi:hypothetical protein